MKQRMPEIRTDKQWQAAHKDLALQQEATTSENDDYSRVNDPAYSLPSRLEVRYMREIPDTLKRLLGAAAARLSSPSSETTPAARRAYTSEPAAPRKDQSQPTTPLRSRHQRHTPPRPLAIQRY